MINELRWPCEVANRKHKLGNHWAFAEAVVQKGIQGSNGPPNHTSVKNFLKITSKFLNNFSKFLILSNCSKKFFLFSSEFFKIYVRFNFVQNFHKINFWIHVRVSSHYAFSILRYRTPVKTTACNLTGHIMRFCCTCTIKKRTAMRRESTAACQR